MDAEFEYLIGIDAAISYSEQYIWNTFRYKRPFSSGVYLTPELWDLVEEDLKTSKFPDFKCNIFVQYKRPEYIFRSNGAEYKKFWKQPYFRYKIKMRQQGVLYNLEQNIPSNSIVVYGCAAFWTYKNLYEFYGKTKLIENSNFIQPHKLQNHKKYTFINSGNVGKAFSKPTDIEGLNIINYINRMSKSQKEFNNNLEFLLSLNKSLEKVIMEFDDEYKRIFMSMKKTIKIPNYEIAIAFKNILLFTFITNTRWFIVI